MAERRVATREEGAVVTAFSKRQVSRLVRDASMHVYFHLGVKCTVFALCCVLGVVGIASAMGDIRIEKDKLVAVQLTEIQKCADEFFSNKCEDNDRPGLLDFCAERRECMEKDPDGVPTLKIVARYSATVINEFVNLLSPKTIGAVAIVAAVAMWIPR